MSGTWTLVFAPVQIILNYFLFFSSNFLCWTRRGQFSLAGFRSSASLNLLFNYLALYLRSNWWKETSWRTFCLISNCFCFFKCGPSQRCVRFDCLIHWRLCLPRGSDMSSPGQSFNRIMFFMGLLHFQGSYRTFSVKIN